jgi:cellobiose epimerase
MDQLMEQYRLEVQDELDNILSYWMRHTLDEAHGGFVGRIDHAGRVYPEAPKGSVLNSRILWSFSAAYAQTGREQYLLMARCAFEYFTEYFIDKEHGGVYWTVDYLGRPLETRKQVYAQAFAIYALADFYGCSKDERVRDIAIEIYRALVKHAYDKEHGGYVEALARDWSQTGELRLSPKDMNVQKSMNTHLHVLEGFACLYRAWADEELKHQMKLLIEIFLGHIIDKDSGHLQLFFSREWQPVSEIISYGHDVEAAWLVQEAAELVDDEGLLEQVKKVSVQMADAAARGLDEDGGLWYEHHKELVKEKHWWPQAEAMVGFFNAYQLTGDDTYLERSLNAWKFIKDCILDNRGGEWYWGVHADYSVMDGEDKVGLWKCPYHNSRACMEIMKRIKD